MKKRATETIYGIHPVFAAIAAGRRSVEAVLLVEGKHNQKQYARILGAASQHGITVDNVSAAHLASLTGTDSHQGVGARVSPYPFEPVEMIAAKAHKKNAPFILVTDHITDPRNLGALARTALCAGADGIVIPKNNSASPTPSASKASAGAIEFLPISRVTNIARTLDLLKEKGLWVTGLEKDAPKPIYESDLTGPVALVVGGEGKGLGRLVKQKCDFIVSIPQSGPVESLNVSVAGAIAMYEMVRQKIAGQSPRTSQ